MHVRVLLCYHFSLLELLDSDLTQFEDNYILDASLGSLSGQRVYTMAAVPKNSDTWLLAAAPSLIQGAPMWATCIFRKQLRRLGTALCHPSRC